MYEAAYCERGDLMTQIQMRQMVDGIRCQSIENEASWGSSDLNPDHFPY